MMGRGAALLDNGDTSMSQTDQECQALKPMINHWLQPQGWPAEVREWGGGSAVLVPTAAEPSNSRVLLVQAGCPEGKAGTVEMHPDGFAANMSGMKEGREWRGSGGCRPALRGLPTNRIRRKEEFALPDGHSKKSTNVTRSRTRSKIQNSTVRQEVNHSIQNVGTVHKRAVTQQAINSPSRVTHKGRRRTARWC